MRSFISFSATLFSSSAALSAETVAFHSASVIFMPLWASFMVLPAYSQSPPDSLQIWSMRLVAELLDPLLGELSEALLDDVVAGHVLEERVDDLRDAFLAAEPLVERLRLGRLGRSGVLGAGVGDRLRDHRLLRRGLLPHAKAPRPRAPSAAVVRMAETKRRVRMAYVYRRAQSGGSTKKAPP